MSNIEDHTPAAPDPTVVLFTTAEKLDQMISAVETMRPDDVAPEMRGFVTGLQVAAGMGFNLLAILRPDDPGDADLMIDQALRLLIMLRGDDLPPFDLSNYGELVDVVELDEVVELVEPDEVAVMEILETTEGPS